MGRITHQDAYSGQLFWHLHGCALLNPEPNQIGTGSQQHWQDVYAEGIRVGDVGLISDSGDFLSLFNIFKSIDDPVNQIYGVPPDFKPLEFRENLLSSSPGLYHSSNARIFSKDTKEIKLGADGGAPAPGMPFAPGLGFELQFSRTQGAVLVLPEGARRVDYLGLPDIRTYTENNAESWYRFINEQVRMDARNGCLYVITGYDRTYCYENVAFQSSSKTSSIYFRAGDLGRLALSYSSLPEHEQRRKASSPGHTLHNLSPFIRGFKVMLNQRFRHKPAIKVLALQGSDVKPDALLYRGSVPNFSSRSASSLNSSSSSSSFRSPAPPSTPSSSSSSGSTRSTQRSDSQISSPGNTLDLSPITSYSSLAEDSDSLSDSLSPRGSSIFDSDSESEPRVPIFQLCHPSDIINEYMLNKLPDTVAAVTHDDEWASVLEKTDTEFPDKFTLISRMLKRFPSKFEPVKPEDDSVLGAPLSSTLQRTSSETNICDESPAGILPHVDVSNGRKATPMPIIPLKHIRPDSDEGEHIGTKRRKLSPDNPFATHGTQLPRRTTFTFNVKLEDFDDNPLMNVHGDMHYSPTNPDQRLLMPYDRESATDAQPPLFSSPGPISIFSSWDSNSIGTEIPNLVPCSSGSESSENSVSLTGDFMGELGGHSGYTPFGVGSSTSEPWSNLPISMLMPYSSHMRSSTYFDSATIPILSSGRCTDESGPSFVPVKLGRDIVKERVASPALAAVASSRRRPSSAKNLHTCDICARTFTTKHNLIHHINSHYGIRDHACDKCGSRFGTKHVLTRHQRTCNGVPRSRPARRQAEVTPSTSGNERTTPSIPTGDFVFVSRRSQTPADT